MSAGLRDRYWSREEDGTTRTVHASEVRPGVFEITDDLLEQVLKELGWQEVER